MNTTSERSKWTLLGSTGHTFWLNPDKPEEIAVCDQSLSRQGQPWTTDDGLLLLDTSEPIRINEHRAIVLPLKSPSGKSLETLIGLKTLEFVCERFKVKVQIGRTLFSRVGEL